MARTPTGRGRGKKHGAKAPRKPRPRHDEAIFLRILDSSSAGTDTAYAVTSFPIHEGESLFSARSRAARSDTLWLSYAHRWLGGIVAGFPEMIHRNADDFIDALALMPVDMIYDGPVSDAKVSVASGRLITSERGEADLTLGVLAAGVHEELIAEFLDVALLAAFQAAMFVAIDIAADSSRNPDLAGIWHRDGTMPKVTPLNAEDRAALLKFHADEMSDLLKRTLLRSDELVRRAGRRSEESRDHRAYCLREWLTQSPDSEFSHMSKHEKWRRARERVIAEVLGPGHSFSNWRRIIASGKKAHQRIAPHLPFCEPHRDPAPAK